VITGGPGDDTVCAGAGDDLVVEGPGSDWLDGEAGIDTVSYEAAMSGVTVDLGAGTATGGDRTRVPYLARAAVACGVDGLFMEVHEDPDRAPSDGPNMLRLDTLPGLLDQLLRLQDAVRTG